MVAAFTDLSWMSSSAVIRGGAQKRCAMFVLCRIGDLAWDRGAGKGRQIGTLSHDRRLYRLRLASPSEKEGRALTSATETRFQRLQFRGRTQVRPGLNVHSGVS